MAHHTKSPLEGCGTLLALESASLLLHAMMQLVTVFHRDLNESTVWVWRVH